jgi:hypothetical protein
VKSAFTRLRAHPSILAGAASIYAMGIQMHYTALCSANIAFLAFLSSPLLCPPVSEPPTNEPHQHKSHRHNVRRHDDEIAVLEVQAISRRVVLPQRKKRDL